MPLSRLLSGSQENGKGGRNRKANRNVRLARKSKSAGSTGAVGPSHNASSQMDTDFEQKETKGTKGGSATRQSIGATAGE